MGVKRYNGVGFVTSDEFNEGMAGKLDAPETEGSASQVLALDANGDPEWVDAATGGTYESTISDSTNAPQSVAVKNYVDNATDALDAQKANKDGYYEQLVSGAAKNLEAPITTKDSFLVRPTGGEETEAADGVAQIVEVEGNSVKFNQLVNDNGLSSSGSSNQVNFTFDSTTHTMTAVGTASATTFSNNALGNTDITLIAGHKYYCPKRIIGSGASGNTYIQVYSTAAGNVGYYGIFTAGANDSGAKVRLRINSGDNVNIKFFLNVFDLTAMGIDNLTTVDAVEAWLEENIGAMAYYSYTTGTVLNNCMEGIAAPGYNLLNPTTGKAQIIGAYSDLYGNYYGIVGTHGALTFTDAYGNESTITPDSDGKFELTVPGELTVASAGDDCAVFLWWDGTKKEYEDYELNHGYLDVKHIYGKLNGAGDLVQVYAAGMPRVGDNKDYLHNVDGSAVADKVIGSRAYTSGDESDSTVITDGTTTYYHLTTELRYTDLVYQGSSYYADGTPVVLPVNYKVSNWSIESIIPQNTTSALVTAPPVLTCKYSLGAVDLLNTHTDEIADLYKKKADKDGAYPEMISGNLVDANGVGTDQEFVYRPTGGGEALSGNGNGVVQTIKGRTLVWNQLVKYINPIVLGDTTHLICTRESDGRYKIVLSEPVSSLTQITFASTTTNGFLANNIYLCTVNADANLKPYVVYNSGNGVWWQITGSAFVSIDALRTETVNTDMQGSLYVGNSLPAGTYYFEPLCFNLTAMFGAGSEPSTTAGFRALYGLSHYPYNAGTLLPYKGTGLKVTGVNQWDEQVILNKSINTTTGAVRDDTGFLVSKNYIPVAGGTTYYYKSTKWPNPRIAYYDSNKSFISFHSSTGNGTFTPPANCRYLLFYAQMIADNQICINISNAALNGQYFPYEEHTLSLPVVGKTAKDGNGNTIVPFPTGVNGDGTTNDEYGKDGGTLRWGVRAYEAGDESDATVITDLTNTAYPLTTPVPFTWDTPLDLIYPAPAGGTEMLLPQGVDESGVPATAPLNATIFYSKDYVQTINDMPKDFDTTASIDALASALGTALGTALDGTFTITRGGYDATNKKYQWSVEFTPNE